jgi:cell division protein FtsB
VKTSPKNTADRRKKKRSRSLARKNLKQSLKLLPFLLPAIFTAFIYTWLYTRTNIVALPIEGLRDERANLVKQNDSLRLKIEQLQAPYRIEAIARNKLGMISPEVWQVVVLDKPVRAPERAAQMAAKAQPRKSNGLLGSLRVRSIHPKRVASQDTGRAG